eukprot:6198732-Pleurochrysis_carterae.AAC.4
MWILYHDVKCQQLQVQSWFPEIHTHTLNAFIYYGGTKPSESACTPSRAVQQLGPSTTAGCRIKHDQSTMASHHMHAMTVTRRKSLRPSPLLSFCKIRAPASILGNLHYYTVYGIIVFIIHVVGWRTPKLGLLSLSNSYNQQSA